MFPLHREQHEFRIIVGFHSFDKEKKGSTDGELRSRRGDHDKLIDVGELRGVGLRLHLRVARELDLKDIKSSRNMNL